MPAQKPKHQVFAVICRLCVQIELYKIQHNDQLPGAGAATFVQAMTGQTNVAGAVGTDFGPYLQKYLPMHLHQQQYKM